MLSTASLASAVKRPALPAVAALLAAWLFGAARFLAADASACLTWPRLAQPPRSAHNLASYRWGPTVRASSYHREPYAHHLPAFLVDGRLRPTPLEKWASAAGDRRPWLEITWREPSEVSRVVIDHVGQSIGAVVATRDYRLQCIPAWPGESALVVHPSASAVTTHALHCLQASGLRIDWMLSRASDPVSAYEVEVWGQ